MRVSASQITSFTVAAILSTLLTACSKEATNNPPAAVPAEVTSEESVSYEEGTPGSVTQRVTTLTAIVQTIDYDKRTLTINDEAGKPMTIVAPAEAVNFPQIQKGDQVNIEFVEQAVISVANPAEVAAPEDSSETTVNRAPEGNKPELEVQASQVITAKVTAIDVEAHTATLQFADGSSRVVNVRSDVELKPEQVGHDVVFETSQYLLLKIEKAAAEQAAPESAPAKAAQ